MQPAPRNRCSRGPFVPARSRSSITRWDRVGRSPECLSGAALTPPRLYDPDTPDHKGRQFASSRSRGESLSFVYGLKRVLPGLEKGLAGMRVGGRRTLVVPPNLGYDGLKYPRPADVPAEATLVFDVS